MKHLRCASETTNAELRLENFNLTLNSINKVDRFDGLLFAACKYFLEIESFTFDEYQKMLLTLFPESWKVFYSFFSFGLYVLQIGFGLMWIFVFRFFHYSMFPIIIINFKTGFLRRSDCVNPRAPHQYERIDYQESNYWRGRIFRRYFGERRR